MVAIEEIEVEQIVEHLRDGADSVAGIAVATGLPYDKVRRIVLRSGRFRSAGWVRTWRGAYKVWRLL